MSHVQSQECVQWKEISYNQHEISKSLLALWIFIKKLPMHSYLFPLILCFFILFSLAKCSQVLLSLSLLLLSSLYHAKLLINLPTMGWIYLECREGRKTKLTNKTAKIFFSRQKEGSFQGNHFNNLCLINNSSFFLLKSLDS